MGELDPLLVLAKRVIAEARDLGIDSALIGALALARHGYIRGTADVDLGTCVPLSQVAALAERLRDGGLLVEFRRPDSMDALNGVIDIRESEDDEPIQIVNFRRQNPGLGAIQRATESDGFACVSLPDLIALKLYAGSRFDVDDVDRLLAENTDANLDEIRKVCAESGLEEALENVLARAR